MQPVPRPLASTGRRPKRSDSRPKSTRAGTSTTAYVEKIAVSTSGEKLNRPAYTW